MLPVDVDVTRFDAVGVKNGILRREEWDSAQGFLADKLAFGAGISRR